MGFLDNLSGTISSWFQPVNDSLADSPVGSFLGMAQNKEAKRQFNTSLDWAKTQYYNDIALANSAHQREIADLEKAGINPVLTATGGSGSAVPSKTGTISPTAHMDYGSALNFLTQCLGSVANLKNASSNAKVADAQADKLKAESGFLSVQKELQDYLKPLKKYESEHFEEIFKRDMSKSAYGLPSGLYHGIQNLMSELSQSQTAKSFESLGGKIYDAELNAEHPDLIIKGLDKIEKNIPLPKGIKGSNMQTIKDTYIFLRFLYNMLGN